MVALVNADEEMSLTDRWELLESQRRPARTLMRSDIPTQKGVYGWFRASEVIYIGTATGGGGLRNRIGHHLSPRYLESRSDKLRPEDQFQLSCGVLLNGRPAVDKSVFRRSLGRSLKLSPGEGTVDHIRQNLSVGWIPFPPDDVGKILSVEDALIKMKRPTLNVRGRVA